VEQERLKRELELCRQIQNDMLPREPFRGAFADVKGISLPAREVGGDFFNYFTMGDGDLAVLVGDVSGKGVSAALTMANVQATLKARLPLMADLADLVDSIDKDFEESSPRGVYATLFAGVLDRTTHTLRYVNAGHHPQFVLRVDGSIVRLPSTGMPIGMLPGQGYVSKEIALAEGDLLFFYTDGAVETENDKGEMFGSERLEALLVAAHNDGVDAVLERAEAAVRAFRGAAEPFDDATMMAMRVGR
jgi:sigma-B regulation protein RsbU (phosphoserine phosphatase)